MRTRNKNITPPVVIYEYQKPKNDENYNTDLFNVINRSTFLDTQGKIGTDWLDKDCTSVLIISNKYDNDNDKNLYVDFITMLMTVLNSSLSLSNYIKGCITIRFDKPYIPLKQELDTLSPFLIATFLTLLKKLVIKGLRKSYFEVEENLQSKIKGKILFSKHLQKNVMSGNVTRHYCRYEYFGDDIVENKIIKTTLLFIRQYLNKNNADIDTSHLKKLYGFVFPVFANVSEMTISECKQQRITKNTLYPEYNDIIKYAQLILQRFSYNISNYGEETVETPPFSINMNTLFELYIYVKLEELLVTEDPQHKLEYQKEIEFNDTIIKRKKEICTKQKPDFLLKYTINNVEYRCILDAKNKKEYKDGAILEDIRQLAGYSRLTCCPDFISDPVDCIIIYPVFEDANDALDKIVTRDLDNYKISDFRNFYKIGIKLPTKTKTK